MRRATQGVIVRRGYKPAGGKGTSLRRGGHLDLPQFRVPVGRGSWTNRRSFPGDAKARRWRTEVSRSRDSEVRAVGATDAPWEKPIRYLGRCQHIHANEPLKSIGRCGRSGFIGPPLLQMIGFCIRLGECLHSSPADYPWAQPRLSTGFIGCTTHRLAR